MSKNDGTTRLMIALLAARGLPEPVQEFRFHPVRKWRFDVAWESLRVAVEVDGATWAQGRHTRGAGFRADCEKTNAAAEMDWLVLRYPTDLALDEETLNQIARVLAGRMQALHAGEL